jgi:hypothetical protein
MINRYGRQPIKHQPVFIIGAPRTGSTILYQVLTNQLDVLYIDNLTCIFRNNLFYGFWLSDRLFRQKAHNCFQSSLGNTMECGLRAPSECGGYWYRWLPKDHHFIDHDKIDDRVVDEIRKEVIAVTNYFNKPIVFKNLNAGQRIRMLSRCFPEAKYLFIKRDPLFTAQSINNARKKLAIPDDKIWSIKPFNFIDLEKLSVSEHIVKQIYFLERQILMDLHLIGEGCFLQIDYEELKVPSLIGIVQKFIHANSRPDAVMPNLNITQQLKVTTQQKNAFEEEIKKLDWKTYGLS